MRRGAFEVRLRCVSGALEVCSKCVCGVFEVRLRCVSGTFEVCKARIVDRGHCFKAFYIGKPGKTP